MGLVMIAQLMVVVYSVSADADNNIDGGGIL